MHQLDFSSELTAPAATVWAWAVSIEGVLTEMKPLARMTVPAGRSVMIDSTVELGRPMLRSWLLLFGLLPVDRTDLTLIEYEEGRRFVEESPMLGMKLWRHERVLTTIEGGTRLEDHLTFEPRLPGPVVPWFVNVFFTNRHRVLRREFSGN